MNLKRILAGALTAASLSASVAPLALAAAPDGVGPWADTVVSASQGLRKDGSPVDVIRSDATQALGAAETTGTPDDAGLVNGTFFSLGFGGSIVLGFDGGIKNDAGFDVTVFESTNPGYQDEAIMVEASEDGSTWFLSTPVQDVRDSSYDFSPNITCAKFVRITDVTNPATFEPTADAFDLDAVKSLHAGCDPSLSWKCHTFEFNDALYFKLWPNKRPGGTVNIPNNIPSNVNGHSNHVNIALQKATAFNATDQRKLLGWYLAMQMSLYKNGGAGSAPVQDILWGNLGCWSTWGTTSVTLSNGVTLDQNSMFKDLMMQVQFALANNNTADYAVLIGLLSQLSQSPY